MLLTLSVLALMSAPPPLPELRTEATAGGSIFHVRNNGSQPLTAYFIELENYPGSFYQFWQDETNAPIPPGGEIHIPNTNMTVGAVPEYVKLQAAIYADGTTAGTPEKVAQLQERRRHTRATARDLITRLEKAPPATSADLKQWADSIPAPTRANRNTQAAINGVAAKSLILDVAAKLEKTPPAEVLATLRAAERALGN